MMMMVTSGSSSIDRSDPKSSLLKQIDGTESDLFVCPESLAPLKLVYRQFGFVDASYLRSDDKSKNREYPVRHGQYIDLTLPEEDKRPLWTRSVDELVGEGFFQNPFISTVYERGYRDNFKSKLFTTIITTISIITSSIDAILTITILS
jgi:hypothetical protein